MLAKGVEVQRGCRNGMLPVYHSSANKVSLVTARRQRTRILRCHAQGNNTFDQFMQWGKGLLKRTLAPSPQKRSLVKQPSADEESDPEGAGSDPQTEATSTGALSNSAEESEPAEISNGLSPEMEERLSEFRHMALTGREITEHWPPPGTPTWSQWMDAFVETVDEGLKGHMLDAKLAKAVEAEDYAAAAETKAQLEEIMEQDIVLNFTQNYNAALETEDFREAARIRDEGAVGLRGWWYLQSSSAENPSHLLRVRQTFNRYIFAAYSPEHIAEIHGITGEIGNMVERQESTYIAQPSSNEYDGNGQIAAELLFQEFPAMEEDGTMSETETKLWSQAIANYGSPTDDEEVVEVFAGNEVDELTDGTFPIVESEEEDSQTGKVGEAEEAMKQELALGELSEDFELSITDFPSFIQTERVPAHITRFDGDRDRFLLTVAPTSNLLAREAKGMEEPQEAASTSDSGSDGEAISAVQITPVDPDKILSKKEIMDKMNAMLAEKKGDSLDSNAPARLLAIRLSIRSQDLKKQIEELAKEIRNIKDTGRTEIAADVLRRILENMQLLKEDAKSFEEDKANGLRGTLAYKRLPTGPSTDPFSGLFVGNFGAHGPEIIQLQRTVGEDSRTYVEGTKLTGDTNVPAGQVAFKAAIGSREAIPGYMTYPPELGIRVGYTGQGRVAKANYTDARWVEGSLLQFQSRNNFSQGAELGFIYNMGVDNRVMILLHRICLDDPTKAIP